MRDKFTERVRKCIFLAREEAVRLRHDAIGTEHLLLGMIGEGEGIAATAIRNLGVDLHNLRHALEETMPEGESSVERGETPFTPGAKRALELSVDQARQLGHNYVGTEHLLLGLICQTEGSAARILTEQGVKWESARDEVLRLLPGKPQPEPTSEPSQPTEGFTERVRKCIFLAREEARRLQHESVGTEHLLLGILQEGSGIAATVLMQLGMDLEGVRQAVESMVQQESGTSAIDEIRFTSNSKRALELSVEEARSLGDNYVGTQHVLLGLIREGEGVAAKILVDRGIDLNKVRAETFALLSRGKNEGISPERESSQSTNAGTNPLSEVIVFGLAIDEENNSPLVILRETWNTRRIPIRIGLPEAEAIAMEMARKTSPRPFTHDLVLRVLDELGIRYVCSEIVSLVDGVYYAILRLRHREQQLLISARPSDAIALALKCKTPIYVNPRFVDNEGGDRNNALPTSMAQWSTTEPPDGQPESPSSESGPGINAIEERPMSEVVEVHVQGVTMDEANQLPVLNLTHGSRSLSIYIRPPEAAVIAREVAGKRFWRPLTHDVLVDILTRAGIEHGSALIHKRPESFLCARLNLRSSDGDHSIDCRPSDAATVSLKMKWPLFVYPELLSGSPQSAVWPEMTSNPPTADSSA
jgi:bifunctional DNase/RNase